MKSKALWVLLKLPQKYFVGLCKFAFLLGFFASSGITGAALPLLKPVSITTNMGTVVNNWQGDLQRTPNYLPAPQIPPNDDLLDFSPEPPVAPSLTESERLEKVTHADILQDPMNRVGDEFNVPEGMGERVKFWFDIYTRHGSATHVLHHVRYPWVVYEILDFTEAIQNGSGPKWLRVDRAQKYAHRRANEIRTALRRLAANPLRKKTDLEKHLVKVLKQVPGARKKVYALAAQQLRSQLGQRDFFISGLRRSSRYLPYMEEIFAQAGLPKDLTRMPFVESSFNEKAESKVGASGIWQVMPATGRAYGLVTDTIDERNSPLKATTMAAKLLRSYYRALGNSWPLAITSYNHGIGNIQSAIRGARSHELPVIIKNYHRGDFKFASSNFYSCFLAALYAERYSDVAFPSVAREAPLNFERYVVAVRSVRLHHLIRLGGLDKAKVIELNLDLNSRRTNQISLPRGFVLLLTPGSADLLPEGLRRRLKPIRISTND